MFPEFMFPEFMFPEFMFPELRLALLFALRFCDLFALPELLLLLLF